LTDPRTGKVHYVGKTTVRPENRFQHHWNSRISNPAKRAWLEDLERAGLRPEHHILEQCRIMQLHERERFWIHYWLDQDAPVTNVLLVS
jgi:hypothetical protein